jgi:pimeloyl-ACP methyl ester carboxylesterase
VVNEFDVAAGAGGTLHAYEHGDGDLTVLWFHGTPNIGAPPVPLFAAAARLGVRFVGYDRPGYGGSTPRPGRTIASAAGDAAAVADALGLTEFAVLGHSGGGPHALAAAALLPGRVTAAVAVSGMAPFTADGLDWFAGMGPQSAATLRAAAAGRSAAEAHAALGGEADFVPADWAALAGEWGWFGSVVGPAVEGGPAAQIDDDLAYVAPWGFDPASIDGPVLLIHGADDLMVPAAHSQWLSRRVPGARLRTVPDAGHISVLTVAAVEALEWIAGTARR